MLGELLEGVQTILKTDFTQWIGRTQQDHAVFDESAAVRHAATVGFDAGRAGAVMPLLSHWCAFTPNVDTTELSNDGHPKLGGFLPPVHLERRMWAGGTLTFHAPLHIGARLTRHSEIKSITEKEGANGPMLFVSLAHAIFEDDRLCVEETQDIVYLNIPQVFVPPKPKPVPSTPDMIEAVAVTEPLLFRFSAITFNAHRIHYDLPYAKSVEKYPGLVVHGPLQAMLLLRAAIRHSGRDVRQFQFRGIHPMFHFDDMHLFGETTEDGMKLCTGLVDGHQGMQATTIWEEK